MKSLFLVGLLALSGTFFMSGCSVEDSVKDIVENDAKPNIINVVNGTAGTITVAVTGKSSAYVTSQSLQAKTYNLTGSSKYTVSYNGSHSKSFSYGSTYLYAAATCNNNGYVSDQIDKNRVHVVNLTGSTFTDNIYVKDANGASYTITDNAAACGVTATNQFNNIVVGNGMQVKIGNGNWQMISGIPAELVSLANSIRVDVVVYSSSTGTLVPMARYDDLY